MQPRLEEMQEQSTFKSIAALDKILFHPEKSDGKICIYFCSVGFDWDAAPSGLNADPLPGALPNMLPEPNVLGFVPKAGCAPEAGPPNMDG